MAHIVLARAWNNGKFLPNGGGYGIWLTNYFKDEYLDVNWVSITLERRAGKSPPSLPSTPMLSGAAGASCAAASSASG